MSSDHLIVGLGNPGRQYEGTRHNIGWDVIDGMSEVQSSSWKEKFKGLYQSQDLFGQKFYFLKPQTYMNLSGESVRPAMDFFKISKENVLVIHDELDLAFGSLAFKPGGGLAGHNGLKSIAAHLGDGSFKRLRLGIGRPTFGSVSDWVLSKYQNEESARIEDYFTLAQDALRCYMEHGFNQAASKFSKKSI
jgi:peptidyl-tRNA hydrolase, PTH1 family